MERKNEFIIAAKESKLSPNDFFIELEEIKKNGGRTPYMNECMKEKNQYYIQDDPYQNSYNYYKKKEEELGGPTRMRYYLDDIKAFLEEQNDLKSEAKQSQGKDKSLKQQPNKKEPYISSLEDIKRKTKKIDDDFRDEYIVQNNSTPKLKTIQLKRETINGISELVRKNTSLSFYEFSRLVRDYMVRHLPILFSTTKEGVQEILDTCGEEFHDFDFGPAKYGEYKKFSFRYQAWEKIKELNDQFSLDMSMQELGRRLFRYYAYRVYKIFES